MEGKPARRQQRPNVCTVLRKSVTIRHRSAWGASLCLEVARGTRESLFPDPVQLLAVPVPAVAAPVGTLPGASSSDEAEDSVAAVAAPRSSVSASSAHSLASQSSPSAALTCSSRAPPPSWALSCGTPCRSTASSASQGLTARTSAPPSTCAATQGRSQRCGLHAPPARQARLTWQPLTPPS